MGYLAIARKWRPSRFEDLVGQVHVVQTLKNAIRLERVSHAYLFSGARGVGKTSVARIFAKALRCPHAQDAIPCNHCEECQAVADSRSIDVMEIDGASNNGVEAVRGIRDNVAYGPSSGNYKIYIIDEVHMLSLSAFNALLKTLEEPPPHVIFVFATTEAQKLPLTILSRCQRFEFRRLTHTQVVERLRTILAEEKVEIAEEGLRTLASHSDGSLRDALSLLDQVLSYFGDRPGSGSLQESEIVEALGVNQTSHLTSYLSHVLAKRVDEALQIVSESYLAGIDLKHFAERCLEELRQVYLMRLAHDAGKEVSAESLDLSSGHFQAISELAKQPASDLLVLERIAQILTRTAQDLGWSSLPRFVLEMATVRMCHLTDLSRVEAAVLRGETTGQREGEGQGQGQVQVQAQGQVEAKAPVEPAPQRPKPSAAPITRPQVASTPGNQAVGSWKAFVDAVMKKRPLLGALLCHANFKFETGEKGRTVILAFPAGSFYERQAGDSKNRSEIDEQLKAFFGRETCLTLSSDTSDTINSIEQSKQAEAESLKKAALEHPSVAKAKEILGAEVVDVNVEV